MASTQSMSYRMWVGGFILLGLLGLAACGSNEARKTVAAGTSDPASADVSVEVLPAASAASERSCSVDAPASIDRAKDDPRGERSGHFAPSERPAPGRNPMTKSEAESVAKEYRERDPKAATQDYQATAVETRYADYKASVQEETDPFINPDRCIWVVTVQAPFVPSPPPGGKAETYEQYRVLLDEGSHDFIELKAYH